MNIHDKIREAIAWSSDAAREHVRNALFLKEIPDPETSMGLWQSFQATFPAYDKEGRAMYRHGDYDILVTVYATTYKETVNTLVKAFAEANV